MKSGRHVLTVQRFEVFRFWDNLRFCALIAVTDRGGGVIGFAENVCHRHRMAELFRGRQVSTHNAEHGIGRSCARGNQLLENLRTVRIGLDDLLDL